MHMFSFDTEAEYCNYFILFIANFDTKTVIHPKQNHLLKNMSPGTEIPQKGEIGSFDTIHFIC